MVRQGHLNSLCGQLVAWGGLLNWAVTACTRRENKVMGSAEVCQLKVSMQQYKSLVFKFRLLHEKNIIRVSKVNAQKSSVGDSGADFTLHRPTVLFHYLIRQDLLRSHLHRRPRFVLEYFIFMGCETRALRENLCTHGKHTTTTTPWSITKLHSFSTYLLLGPEEVVRQLFFC